MKDDSSGIQDRRRYIRLPLTENLRALDAKGRDIGRVEKVGAGGMQIRLAEGVPEGQFPTGSTMDISIVEPDNIRNNFRVEVRVCEGNLLGVQFPDALEHPSTKK